MQLSLLYVLPILVFPCALHDLGRVLLLLPSTY